jgi:hypothetical protein
MNHLNLTDRQLLEEIYKAQQEDHQKINRINRRLRFQFTMGILKWVFYISLAVGLYAFVQPYVENVTGIYSSLKEGAESINEIRSDISNFQFSR